MEVIPEVTVGEVSGDIAAKASLVAAAANVTLATDADGAVPEPITLEEAKAHLRVYGADEDAYITALITVAREMAEGRINRTIRQRTRAARFRGWNDEFLLPKPPFVSIDTITYADENGQVQTLDATAYYVAADDEDAPGTVEFVPGLALPLLYRRRRPVTVSYLAGYAEGQVPRAILQWMLLAIGALYEHRESIVGGTITATLPDDFMKLLIQPYMVYE